MFLYQNAAGQILNAPPATTASGGTFNAVIISATGNLTAMNLTINPGNGQANGISATATSPASAIGTFTKTTINLSGGGLTGIFANGTGASVTLGAGSSIVGLNGGGNFGVKVNGGMVTLLDDASINISGGGGNFPIAVYGGGTFDMTDGSVTVSNGGGNGILVGTSNFGGTNFTGTLAMHGTTINMLGSNGGTTGLVANFAGSTATLDDVTVNLTGNGGGNFGVQATGGSSVAMTGGSVNVSATGGGNIGVQVTGAGSTTSLDGTRVTVSDSNGSIGAQVTTGGRLTATGGEIETSGPNSTGLQLNNGATAAMTGGRIATTGANGQAILVSGAGLNNATFDGTEVASASGNGIVANGTMSSTLDFSNGASVSGGNGTLLLNQTTSAGSIVNLNATNEVHLAGDVNAIGSAGTTNISLAEDSTLSGAINANTLTGAVGINPAQPPVGLPPANVNVSLTSGSSWEMRTSSTVGTLNVGPGSHVTFLHGGGSSFTTLVVNNLTGTGGTFTMEVDLDAAKGDLLLVQNSSEGSHVLDLINRDQGSDLPPNSALLVAQTPDGGATFRGEADGGTFKYVVARGDGSAVTPDPNDWYLVRGDSPNVPDPMDPIEDLTNTSNAAIGTASGMMPLYYRDFDPVVEEMQDLRVQCEEAGPGAGPANADGLPYEVWMKGYGSNSRLNNETSRVFNQDQAGFQIGADRRFSLGKDALYLGGFAGYFHGWRDFLDGGTGATDAFSAGLYGEWLHPCGWYANLVAKQTYFWNSFSTPTNDGLGAAATGDSALPTLGGLLEFGKRCDFGMAFVEPQARLEGVWADSSNYTASDGLVVHQHEEDSLRGSLGVRTGLHFPCADGVVFEPYTRVAVVNEFLGDARVETDTTAFEPRLSGLSIEASAGVSVKVESSLYVFSEYQYASSVDSDRTSMPWALGAGVRYLW